MNQAFTPAVGPPSLPLSLPGGGAGLALSATSTSPLGSTYSQRGCFRSFANADTDVPGAATGLAPSGQPLAGAMSTVGISVLLGAGSLGSGPTPAENGRVAISPHAARAAPRAIASAP